MSANKETAPTLLPSPLLTTPQVADWLGLRPQTLDRWRMNGEGPPFLSINGRAVRYRKADVDAYLDASLCANTLEAGASRAP